MVYSCTLEVEIQLIESYANVWHQKVILSNIIVILWMGPMCMLQYISLRSTWNVRGHRSQWSTFLMAGIPPSVELVCKELTIIYNLICMAVKKQNGTFVEVCENSVHQFLNRSEKALTIPHLSTVCVSLVDVVLCCDSDDSLKDRSTTLSRLHCLCVKQLPQVKGKILLLKILLHSIYTIYILHCIHCVFKNCTWSNLHPCYSLTIF